MTEPANLHGTPQAAAGQGCAGWAMWYAASGLFAISGWSLLLGAWDTNLVLVGIGLAALIPGVLVGRPGLRRIRAGWAAQRRADEWLAGQPGGRDQLRARLRRATVTVTVGMAALLGYLLVTAPLLAVITVAGVLLVLLPCVPHIRRRLRWYRSLVTPDAGSRLEPDWSQTRNIR
jgi:hypothetical protein